MKEQVVIKSTPGSIYMATMCSAEHFIKHDIEDGELLHVAGVGPVKVVVLLRSNVMNTSRGRVRPNSDHLFKLVQALLNEWMQKRPLQLPTLKDCLALEVSLVA